jgi:hypothetical protein
VAPIPTNTFYFNQRHGEQIVRFTVGVGEPILATAAKRLANLKKGCRADPRGVAAC